jgi:hypothetical protein
MSNDDFRERLLELEGYPEDLRKSLEEAVRRLREEPLTRWTRPIILFWCIPLALGVMVYLGWRASTGRAELPLLNRIEAITVVVMSGTWLAWGLATLRRGTVRLLDTTAMANIAFAFVIVVLCGSLLLGKVISADLVAGVAVVGFVVTWNRIKASELHLRENILRLELTTIHLMKEAKASFTAQPPTSALDGQE